MVPRFATWPERAGHLLDLGTWTLGDGQVIHFDRENGLRAEPRRPLARVRCSRCARAEYQERHAAGSPGKKPHEEFMAEVLGGGVDSGS